jgi:hypothetical protein
LPIIVDSDTFGIVQQAFGRRPSRHDLLSVVSDLAALVPFAVAFVVSFAYHAH